MGFRGVENGAEGMGNEKKRVTTNDKEAGKTECFLDLSGPCRSLPNQRITRPGLERLPYIPAQSADYKMGGTLCGTVRANRGYCWAKTYSAMQA